MDWGVFFTHLWSVVLVGFVPVLALAVGFLALGPLRERWGLPGRPSLALSLALGWGMLSGLMWLLGVVGSLTGGNLFSKWVPWVLVLVALLVSRKWGGDLIGEIRLRMVKLRETTGRYSFLEWVGVAASGLLAALLVGRYLLLALTPSVAYDVLEYHLPAVRWALASGGVAPIMGNAYTQMPQGAEMLFLLGRLFETGSLGPFAPKLINLYLCLSTLILLNAMAREFRVAGYLRYLAVLIFLCHPVSATLLGDGFVGMATALYATGALICFLRACRLPNRLDPALAGVFLGLVFSCKYPAVGIFIFPFLLFLVPVLPKAAFVEKIAGARAWVRVPVAICLMGAVVGATYSPWLLRSLVYEGSPFPPLMGKWVGEDLSPGEAAIGAFMKDSHRMESPLTGAYFSRVVDRASEAGRLLLMSALFFLFSPHSDRRRRGMGILALAGYLVWCCVPHGAVRFLAPLLPALAVMGVLLVCDLKRWLPKLYLLTALPLVVWVGFLARDQFLATAVLEQPRVSIRYALGGASKEFYLEKHLGVTGGFFNALNASVRGRGEAKVLMLYEARGAGVSPEAEVVCNTIFDASYLWEILRGEGGEDPRGVLERLRKEGFTHLAVNEIELARLLLFYPVPEAREDPGYAAAAGEESAIAFLKPSLLAFRRYYPPYYYFSSAGESASIEGRLDRFLDHVLRSCQLVWGQDVFGAKIWVVAL